MTLDEELRTTVANTAGLQVHDIDDDNMLHDHLGLSSLDLIHIYGQFEERYDIVISDAEAEPVATLAQLRALLEEKIDRRGSV